eukprot:364163-Hanusia_phi.AAC.1
MVSSFHLISASRKSPGPPRPCHFPFPLPASSLPPPIQSHPPSSAPPFLLFLLLPLPPPSSSSLLLLPPPPCSSCPRFLPPPSLSSPLPLNVCPHPPPDSLLQLQHGTSAECAMAARRAAFRAAVRYLGASPS